MRLDRLDRWLGPCLMALALIWLGLAYAYIPGARGEGEPGPRAFPILLGAVLAGLGAMVTAAAFGTGRREAAGEQRIAAVSGREAAIVAGIFGVLMLYAFLLERLGFVVATPIIILATMRGILRIRTWTINCLLAGGVTFACWLIFAKLLEAPLPRGSWRWLL